MSLNFLILRLIYGIKLSDEEADTLNLQFDNFSKIKKLKLNLNFCFFILYLMLMYYNILIHNW
jgi:hypothetical protein